MQVEEVFAVVTCAVESDKETWGREREHKRLPHLTLTYAQSIDGSIAAERGTPTVLSGTESMRMTHLMRTLHDGILVGVGTILADNPSLNARLVTGRNPKPIIVDARLECPLHIKLFTNATCEKPILLCAETMDDDMHNRKLALEAAGAKVITCRSSEAKPSRVDIRHAFECLRAEGIESVMIEGGASIILACLQESARSHLIDRVIVTIAPTFIGGLSAVGYRVVDSGSFPRLVKPDYFKLGSDLIILGRLC